MLSNSEESPIFAKLKTLNYRDLLIFLIPFFIFLYYLHVFDPGLVGYDSFNQLHQIATGEFTNCIEDFTNIELDKEVKADDEHNV